MTNYLITGVAGFIGSNLAKRLLDTGHTVIGIDQIFQSSILNELSVYPNFIYHPMELGSDNPHEPKLRGISDQVDFVFHLAANADIRFSAERPHKDLESIIVTYDLLRWMKNRNIKHIAYASSAAMYGDPPTKWIPTPEYYHPIQTSFYGASKAACEGLIEAHCAAYDTQAWLFRFSSIIGEGYSHGFIYNFYKALKKVPSKLYVHGGQDQFKSYLYIQDCINGMLDGINLFNDQINTLNLGHLDIISLPQAIPIITKRMGLKPAIIWSGKEVGWIGDSKICHLDTVKLRSVGWYPKVSIKDAIERTVDWLDTNPWILERGEI